MRKIVIVFNLKSPFVSISIVSLRFVLIYTIKDLLLSTFYFSANRRNIRFGQTVYIWIVLVSIYITLNNNITEKVSLPFLHI